MTGVLRGVSLESSFDTAQVWIGDCDEKHQCMAAMSGKGAWNPKRLLDLDNLSKGNTVRLRRGSEIASNSQYTTLSHCWGSHNPDRLDLNSQ